MADLKDLENSGLTVKEFAELTGETPDNIYKKIQRGKLRAFKVGKNRIIPYIELLKYNWSIEAIRNLKKQKEAEEQVEEEGQRESEENEIGVEVGDDEVAEKEGGDIIPQETSRGGSRKKERGPKASKDALKPVEKLLGESYAKTLVPTLESLEWWNTAKELIAWHSIMIALQVAKVDPQEIVKKAEEFQDPVKFADYVKELLSAMVEAIDDATVIQQYKVELEDTQRQLEACMFILDKQAERIRELESDLSFALQRLSKKDLLAFYVWKGYIQPSVLFGGKVGGGVDNGGGGSGNEEIC